jgi:broad specificity phosphatase PhoE
VALRLLVVRHGETDWNRARRYQGWQDTPLSETGRSQAEAVGRLLAGERLAAVWSSPLARARDTASIIAGKQELSVREAPAFKEMHFGDWEGLTTAEVSARYPALYQNWRDTPHLVVVPGGEALSEVQKRVLAGLVELRAAHDGETICLVAHGISARILILEALGLGLDRVWSLEIATTGVSELEFRGDWAAVHRMNSLVHLDRVAGRP